MDQLINDLKQQIKEVLQREFLQVEGFLNLLFQVVD